MEVGENVVEVENQQAGGSMIEKLPNDMMVHVFSFLDPVSLCRLSMTNSVMRKIANDDGVWKVLYRKDFYVQQEAVILPNGWTSWKAYYAVTKAIMGVNARFYNIIRERSLPAMSSLWLNANRLNANQVECIHGPRRKFIGYDTVINRWASVFSLQGIDVRIQNVRARISENLAVVTMDAYINGNFGPFYETNVYELHDGQWFIVHHHRSIMMQEDPHNIFG